MIRKLIPSALALGLIAVTSAQNPASGEAKPDTPAAGSETAEAEGTAPDNPAELTAIKSDASYALGFQTGGRFAQQFGQFGLRAEDLDTHTFLKGFLDSFKGQEPEVNQEQLQKAMESLASLLQKREEQTGAANLEAGREFLEKNAKREGVTVTKSGLQYEVIEKGGDEKYTAPKEGEEAEQQFMVNYRGTLVDGTEFDASTPGQPVPMTLGVIEGFKEALTTMPVGAKWRLFIPSELAYGAERRGPDIAPNSVLIFELELVNIEDAPPAPQGGFPFPVPEAGE